MPSAGHQNNSQGKTSCQAPTSNVIFSEWRKLKQIFTQIDSTAASLCSSVKVTAFMHEMHAF